MLAFTGALVQSYGMHFDGKMNGMFYEKGVNPFEATPSAFATNPMGMAQILLFIGLTEGYTFPEGAWSGDMKRDPGDLGYRVMRSADVMEEQQIKELKNGGAPRPFLCLVRVRSRDRVPHRSTPTPRPPSRLRRAGGFLTSPHPRRPCRNARHHGVLGGALHPGQRALLLQRVGAARELSFGDCSLSVP